jgi:hypothetical protein
MGSVTYVLTYINVYVSLTRLGQVVCKTGNHNILLSRSTYTVRAPEDKIMGVLHITSIQKNEQKKTKKDKTNKEMRFAI